MTARNGTHKLCRPAAKLPVSGMAVQVLGLSFHDAMRIITGT